MLQFAAQQGRLAVVEHLLHEARRLQFPLEDLVDDVRTNIKDNGRLVRTIGSR